MRCRRQEGGISPWRLGFHPSPASECPPQRCTRGGRRWTGQCSRSDQQEVIHSREADRKQSTKEHSVCHQASALLECECVFVSVPVCLCTDHSELVGRGPVLKQQVDDVGVALLSCLVERSVAVLNRDAQTGEERNYLSCTNIKIHRKTVNRKHVCVGGCMHMWVNVCFYFTLVLPFSLAWFCSRKFAIFALP